jgi:hypothetical protein
MAAMSKACSIERLYEPCHMTVTAVQPLIEVLFDRSRTLRATSEREGGSGLARVEGKTF